MSDDDGFFGTDSSTALMKRSATLWQLLKDDPRYAYYGRVVGLSDPADDVADILCSLACLQGAAVAYYVPKTSAANLFENTPRGFVADVAELCQTCDVMPVPSDTMRGQARRGINLVASDREGRPVASASSFVMHHPSGPHPSDVFWGMLATREDRRGEKIALVLGARAVVHMWDKEGARGFMTGVRDGNSSSQALCNRLGVTDSDWIYAQCLDVNLLGNSTITK